MSMVRRTLIGVDHIVCERHEEESEAKPERNTAECWDLGVNSVREASGPRGNHCELTIQ